MGLMRRAALLAVMVVGCSDAHDPVTPDASIDAALIDALPPGSPDFFGEPCGPSSELGVINVCRNQLPYPKAYCTPAGTCRPFCATVTVSGGGFGTCKDVGGVETWAFSTSPARVCYCEPP